MPYPAASDGAAALAVHAHALGERVGDEEREPGVGHRARHPGVFGHAVAIALVGEVEVGHELALAQQRDQDVPLRARQVDAGRVVAAGVQQHDAARRQRAQRVEHRVEAHAAARRVVVRIAVDLEAGALEHRAVVVPGRVADPDLARREEAVDELGADAQAAARADRLDRRDAPARHGLVPGAEKQLLHRAAAVGRALDRLVRLGTAGGDDLGLGAPHRLEHRDAALVVEVDADRQVDLVRPRILLEGLVQAQDRIAGIGFDVLEHGAGLWAGCVFDRCQAASAASMSWRSDSGLSCGA